MPARLKNPVAFPNIVPVAIYAVNIATVALLNFPAAAWVFEIRDANSAISFAGGFRMGKRFPSSRVHLFWSPFDEHF
jgi:hypothetical protein